MHCPRCGQQQVSNETKFCSRCGFQLGLVAEVLANNGSLPQLNELYSKKQSFFTKKNGVIFSVLWFFFWIMILIFIAIAGGEEEAGVAAIWGFFSTIMLLIVSLAVLPSSRKAIKLPQMDVTPPPTLYGNVAGQQTALPPQQAQTAQEYAAPHGAWRTPTTGELAIPGSVTDPTTKLLKKDQ